MASSGVNEFFEFLEEGIRAPGAFNPSPFYSAESDTLFFYAEDVPSYAKRLNSTLTVFVASDDDRLTGFRVKGVKRIYRQMQRLGKTNIVISDEGIRLEFFIVMALAAPLEDQALERYERDLERFGPIRVDERELQAV